jgi:hypothetical protein
VGLRVWLVNDCAPKRSTRQESLHRAAGIARQHPQGKRPRGAFPDWPATCVVNGNVAASSPERSGQKLPSRRISRAYSGRWNEAGEGWSRYGGPADRAYPARSAGPSVTE